MAGFTFDKQMRIRLAGRWLASYMRFVKKSSSIAVAPSDPNVFIPAESPCIIAVWHGQFVLHAALAPKDFKLANIVARHGDAELIGAAMASFDIALVRGGGAAGRRKDRGGAQALREALRLLSDGTSIAMTADVPPGPARKAGMGIIKLAALSGRPIIPMAAASSRYYAFDTWSRLTLNLPFSKIGYTHGEPVWVARDATPAQLEKARQDVENGVNATLKQAYSLVGADVTDVTPHAALTPTDPPARSSWLLRFYQLATRALTPVLPWFLKYRERHKKEAPASRNERLGRPTIPRPNGTLIWLHAASVGELNAILPLIAKLRERQSDRHFLVTTGTVTSADLAAERLHSDDIHQYVPLDAPACIKPFLDHWRPDLVGLAESEIWPNTIIECHARGIPIALINARISDRSYQRWRRNKATARPLFGRLRLVLAQNERLARRLRELGGRDVRITGNLKVDAPALPVDEKELSILQRKIGSRPVFLAASTHPGEDELVLEAYRGALPSVPGLLLMIVPRHPKRGKSIQDLATASSLDTARRQSDDEISVTTQVYVADTLGELGLFYSLAQLAFIGGSLVERGGQNPIEALRLSCGVISGPSHYNFLDIYREMRRREGLVLVKNANELAASVQDLLGQNQEEALQALVLNGQAALDSLGGGLQKTCDALDTLLTKPPKTAAPQDMRLTRAS